MNPNKESLPTLTVLRYPAAVWVLLFHLHNNVSGFMREPYLAAHPILMAFVDRGFLGVTFFFVLSGFILAYTYDRSFAQTDFYIARAARVLPVYYLSLAVTLPYLLYTAIKSGLASTLVDAFPVLLLLQSWYPPICGFWNTPAWTLSCEAFFYALFPVINLSLGRFVAGSKSPIGKCLGVIAIATLLGSCLPVWTGLTTEPMSQIKFDIRRIQQYPAYQIGGPMFNLNMWVGHFPALRLFEFIIGIATYRLFRTSVESRTWTLREARWMVVVASLFFAGFIVATAGLSFVMLLGALTAPACAALIFAAAAHDRVKHAERQEGPALRFGILLGQSSYAVYLLHAGMLPYLLKVFVRCHLVTSPWMASSFLLMGAVTTVIVTAVSIAVFGMYEEPARLWVKANLLKVMHGRSALTPSPNVVG